MTVTTTEDTVQQVGNGVTTTVAYPYKFFEKSDLVVINTDLTTLVETTLTLTTDYTIPNTDDAEGYPSGTNITLVVAPSSNIRTTVYRDIPFKQGISYPENDPFPSKTHEKGLDKLTLLCQQVLGYVNRALRFSNTSTVSGITVAQPVANKGMKYNSDATQIIPTDLDPDEVYAQAQIAADLAQAAVGNIPTGTALNYLRRNAANTAFENRTPEQVLSDISGASTSALSTGLSDLSTSLTAALDKDISSGGTISTGDIQLAVNEFKTAAITGSTTIVAPAEPSPATIKPIFAGLVFTTTNASYPSTTITNVTWGWSSAPTFSTTKTNIVFLISFNGGTSWFAFYTQGGA